MKALPPSAQKNRDTELKLELLDSAGETRLAHVAGPRRAPEVFLLGDCHQVFELPQEHRFQPDDPAPRLRRVGAQWAGSHFGGMITLTLEKAKTIDSINLAIIGSRDRMMQLRRSDSLRCRPRAAVGTPTVRQ